MREVSVTMMRQETWKRAYNSLIEVSLQLANAMAAVVLVVQVENTFLTSCHSGTLSQNVTFHVVLISTMFS